MSIATTLDEQVRRAMLWAAAASLVTGVIQFFLPLDVPDGYSATLSERAAWLSANTGPVIFGWLNQVVAMLSLSAVFGGIAWQVARTNPLQSILSVAMTALASMAFFINKFMAIWTIPFLADALTTGSNQSEMAGILLPTLNVTIPFSLFTSLDYLGFWLYSLAALLVARPMLQGAPAAKVIGVMLAAFGILYHGMIGGVLGGAIRAAEIEFYVAVVALFLLVMMVAVLVLFRNPAAARD